MHKKYNTMKAVILIRVSTLSQDLKQQTDKVLQDARRRGYEIPEEYILEDKESATKLSEEERHGLTRLKALIETDKEIKAVFAYELSRISRKLSILISIRDFLQAHKVQLYILVPEFKLFDDNWEVGMAANLIFTNMGIMAEEEGRLRNARIKRGKEKRKAEGKKTDGRHLIGFTTNDSGFIVPDPTEADMIKLIFSLYSNGHHSYNSIAEELKIRGYQKRCGGLYDISYIARIIKNPEYYKRGLVSETTFNMCRDFCKTKKVKAKKDYSGVVNLCRGILVYGGGNLEDWANGNKFKTKPTKDCEKFIIHIGNNSYRCRSIRKCISISIMDKLAWEIAKEITKNQLDNIESIEDEKDKLSKHIVETKKEILVYDGLISEVQRKIDRVWDIFIDNRISKENAENRTQKLEGDKKDYKKKLDAARARIIELQEVLKKYDETRKIRVESLDKISDPMEKLKLIRDNIERIEYIGGGKRVSYFDVELKNIGVYWSYKIVSGGAKCKTRYYKVGFVNGEEVLKEIIID